MTAAMQPTRLRCMLYLWLCKELDTVWERSAHCQACRETNFLNFKELLSWILTQTSEVELFAMIAWGIWNQRNQDRLNHTAAPFHQIFQISTKKLAYFTACQPSATPTLVGQVNLRTRWQPPLVDLMKINFNRAVFSSVNAAGIGVAIRNNLGQVIVSCSQRLPQAYSSNEVEALAIAKAVSFAAEIGITKAVLEGDSLTIMKALSSDHSSLVSFGLMIDQLIYSHVKRECNSVAHCLARYVFDSLNFLVWMENVLPQFSVVLQADLADSFLSKFSPDFQKNKNKEVSFKKKKKHYNNKEESYRISFIENDSAS